MVDIRLLFANGILAGLLILLLRNEKDAEIEKDAVQYFVEIREHL